MKRIHRVAKPLSYLEGANTKHPYLDELSNQVARISAVKLYERVCNTQLKNSEGSHPLLPQVGRHNRINYLRP